MVRERKKDSSGQRGRVRRRTATTEAAGSTLKCQRDNNINNISRGSHVGWIEREGEGDVLWVERVSSRDKSRGSGRGREGKEEGGSWEQLDQRQRCP